MIKNLSKFFILQIFVTLLLAFSVAKTHAATLNISRPTNEERVNGVYEINWSVFDTGLPNVAYEMRVKNATCSDVGIAISGQNFLSVVKNGYYTFSWNSATVSDGDHCLQICIKNSAQNYECVQRKFKVVNVTNNPPVITSFPSRLSYTVGQVFEYQVQAYDPDGDPLIYQLLSAPDFIYLNQKGFMTLGNYMNEGSYNISFAVIDSHGGSANQSFTLVAKKAPVVVEPTGSVTPTGTIPVANASSSLEILSPVEASVYAGPDNEIKWKISNLDNSKITQLIIEYAEDNSTTYTQLKTFTGGDVTSFTWDVSDIKNGDYKIRITAKDSKSKNLVQVTSGKFQIANRSDSGKVLAVFKLNPENKQEITELRPTISASMAASEGADVIIDEVKIKLDGSDITDECSVEQTDFKCEMTEDLDLGEHSIEVSVADSNDQTLGQSWIFYIVDSTGEGTPEVTDGGDSGSDGKSTITIPGIYPEFNPSKILPICGGLLFIGLLVMVIVSMSKKKTYDVGGGYSAKEPLSPSYEGNYDNQPFDFSIGNHDVSADSLSVSNPSDLPDWLKGDIAQNSKPAGSAGANLTSGNNGASSDAAGSQVHGSFDLTPSEDE